MNLVKEACKTYGMDLPDFARKINVPKPTLQQWSEKFDKTEKVPRYAIVMLESLIKIKHLEEKDNTVKKLFELYGVLK